MRSTYCIALSVVVLMGCLVGAYAENPFARSMSDKGLPAMALAIGASALTKDGKENKILLKGVEAVGITAVITDLLKSTVREPRPNGGDRSSFPSGHTSAAFAMATVLADDQPKLKWVWYTLAGTIGWSRVDLRAHHTHDVIAGALLGHFVADEVISHNEHHGNPGQVTFFQKSW